MAEEEHCKNSRRRVPDYENFSFFNIKSHIKTKQEQNENQAQTLIPWAQNRMILNSDTVWIGMAMVESHWLYTEKTLSIEKGFGRKEEWWRGNDEGLTLASSAVSALRFLPPKKAMFGCGVPLALEGKMIIKERTKKLERKKSLDLELDNDGKSGRF